MKTSRSYIIVIDPATHTPELDCFNSIANLTDFSCHYHLPALHGFKKLDHQDYLKQANGVVILGSSQSVTERAGWQDQLSKTIEFLIENQVPLFGICYAHQLIAHLYGAKTKFIETKQKGIRKTKIAASSQSARDLIVSHREIVTELPNEFELFASSEKFEFDGLKHQSKPIWTLQAHPEATKEFLVNQNIDEDFDFQSAKEFGDEILRKFLQFCTQV